MTNGRKKTGKQREPHVPEGYDSGEIETLADGSISIPILEEELVLTKRVVVRERIIIHKDSTVDRRHIETELRKERVVVEEQPREPRDAI